MGMNFSNEGYDGTRFYSLHVRKDSSAGPGWFIFGRDATKYGRHKQTGEGNYVSLCGYVRMGKARSYNGTVRIGWSTKREAQAALDACLSAYPFLNCAA